MKILMVCMSVLLISYSVSSQQAKRDFSKTFIVKTNLLNLLARKPSVTVEKAFTNRFSLEASYLQGVFENIALTDHYSYSGLLIRGKRYFADVEPTAFAPYGAVYAGTLKRHIQSKGSVNNSGWFGLPSRDFTGNSIRAGLSAGVLWMSKRRIVIDGQISLGYGRYLNSENTPGKRANGYPDLQLWLSVGYCFR